MSHSGEVNLSSEVKIPTLPVQRTDGQEWGTLHIPFDPEYAVGAYNAVRVCLRVQVDEQVCVITDRATAEIAAAVVAELERLGAPYRAWVLEELAERPLRDLPREILDDLENSQRSEEH